jgi:hypothetical protein
MTLGDLVATQWGEGRIVDVDPDDSTNLLVECRRIVSVRADQLELVERASLLRRCAMRARAFVLTVRDCGWRYAMVDIHRAIIS